VLWSRYRSAKTLRFAGLSQVPPRGFEAHREVAWWPVVAAFSPVWRAIPRVVDPLGTAPHPLESGPDFQPTFIQSDSASVALRARPRPLDGLSGAAIGPSHDGTGIACISHFECQSDREAEAGRVCVSLVRAHRLCRCVRWRCRIKIASDSEPCPVELFAIWFRLPGTAFAPQEAKCRKSLRGHSSEALSDSHSILSHRATLASGPLLRRVPLPVWLHSVAAGASMRVMDRDRAALETQVLFAVLERREHESRRRFDQRRRMFRAVETVAAYALGVLGFAMVCVGFQQRPSQLNIGCKRAGCSHAPPPRRLASAERPPTRRDSRCGVSRMNGWRDWQRGHKCSVCQWRLQAWPWPCLLW
jgi:hypothetical protein